MNKFFFIFLIIMLLIKTGNVFSADNIFNVDNIYVDTKKNKKREELFDNAVAEAFAKLTKRILIQEDREKTLKTPLYEIKRLVSHYEFFEDNESINNKKVKFNITFDNVQINNYFYKKNILYSDVSKLKLIFMPVLLDDNKIFLFSKNFFYDNWQLENKETEYIDYILPLENIEDIELINKNKKNLESININFLNKYDLNNYIYLVINYKKNSTDVFLKSFISEIKVIKNISIDHVNNDKLENYKNIKTILKNYINELWKSHNLIDVRTPSFLNTKLDFKNQSDLLNTQLILSKIDLIQNFSVLELNMNYAKIKIKYLGKIEKLKKNLYNEGLKLIITQDKIRLKLI
jgi:hypothetical protein